MIKNPLITVIVPAYNIENFIERCLMSIINQSYKNLEIIVVNDGSTDKTREIIEKLMMKDNRIFLVNQNNFGASNARNVGIKKASGEYIGFVDGDDTIEPDMYDFLLNLILENKTDIAHCGYKRVEKTGIKVVNGTNKVFLQDHDRALECLITGKTFVGSLCNKLYKKKLFEAVKTNESIKINEDILLNFYLFNNAGSSIFIDVPKYNYIIRENSACSMNAVNKSKQSCMVSLIILENVGVSHFYLAMEGYLNQLARLYMLLNSEKIKNNVLIKKIKDKIIFLSKRYRINNKRIRLKVTLIKYFSFFYVKIYQIYDKLRKPGWDVKI